MYDPLFTESLSNALHISVYVSAALLVLFISKFASAARLLFTVLNLGTVYVVFFHDASAGGLYTFISMVVVLAVHWLLLRSFCIDSGEAIFKYWGALLLPIVILTVIKIQSALVLVGVSYLAFRMVSSSFELRESRQELPSFSDYMGYLVFPATFMAGPINPLKYHMDTLVSPNFSKHNLMFGILRIVVGYIKFRFIATLVYQLSFASYWQVGYEMTWMDFLLSGAAYYLYLYMNFSGYTDIVVGVAAILGIRVKENFDNPLASRNIKDFWRRWHLSLTDLVRDVVFTPLMMQLTRWFGGRFVNLTAIISITALFLVLALWHGLEAGYFIFYGLHAMAFTVIHLSEEYWRSFSKSGYRLYMGSGIGLWCGRIATFSFLAVTCAFLELENWHEIKSVFDHLTG